MLIMVLGWVLCFLIALFYLVFRLLVICWLVNSVFVRLVVGLLFYRLNTLRVL